MRRLVSESASATRWPAMVFMRKGKRRRLLRNLMSPALAACIAAMIGACSLNGQKVDGDAPAQVLSFVGAPPVTDGRARFRHIFCDLLNRAAGQTPAIGDCEACIWRLADESGADGSDDPLPLHDPKLKIFIVPGAFGDCFPELGIPFEKGVDRLRGLGYSVEVIAVEGRSGSEHDARLIAETLAGKTDGEAGRWLLIGYSKGAVDILHFLVDFPELARRVAAVVSVSGAVNGSPLAEKFEGVYGNWLADTLPSRCPPGDKRVLVSLERKVQMRWLAGHPLPPHVAYFSLGTFTDRSSVARILQPSYDLLARIEPRNDGQLLFSDQIIPGSTLLGFADTDHWDIALPVRKAYRFWGSPSGTPKFPEFPRDTLLEAMVLFSIERLAHGDGRAKRQR